MRSVPRCRRSLVLASVPVIGAVFGTAGAAQPRPDFSAVAVETYVTRAMKAWRVPGVSLAVVRGDSVLFAAGYGVRRAGTDMAVDAETRFGLGSCSKAITAAAVGGLVSDGVVGWNTRVVEFVPWLRLYDPWVTRELRVEDLISNRVGLRHGDSYASFSASREEYLRKLRFVEPRSGFRSRYGYSNDMFVLAEQLVVSASGTRWEDYLQRRLFGPLGLEVTTSVAARVRAEGNAAAPHILVGGEPYPLNWSYADSTGTGQGGIVSSARDMSRWLRFQLANGRWNGTWLLDSSVVAAMHTPRIPATAEAIDRHFAGIVGAGPNGLRGRGYGFGWFLMDYRDRPLVWHSGAITGFSCMTALLPEQEIGIYVGANYLVDYMHYGIALWIADALLGFPEVDWSGKFLASFRARLDAYRDRRRDFVQARVADTAPTRPLPAYTGRYSHPGYGVLRVRQDDEGDLVANLGPKKWRLKHWHFDVFELVPLELDHPPDDLAQLRAAMAVFRLDVTGTPTELDLRSAELGVFTRGPIPKFRVNTESGDAPARQGAKPKE